MGRDCGCYLVVALLVFNALLFLIGVAIFGFSIYCFVDSLVQNAVDHAGYTDKMQNLLYSIIALALLTIIISIFGCCGAYHELPCLLGTYSICLTFMFGAELTVGTICLIYKLETEKRIIEALDTLVNNFNNASYDVFFKSNYNYRDIIQKTLHCCGINNAEDYEGPTVPPSCCNPSAFNCPQKLASFSIGCSEMIGNWVRKKFITALVLIMTIPILKVFGLILAISLCCLVQLSDNAQDAVTFVNV